MSTDFLSIIVGGRRVVPRQPRDKLRSALSLLSLIGLVALIFTHAPLALLIVLYGLAVKFQRYEQTGGDS